MHELPHQMSERVIFGKSINIDLLLVEIAGLIKTRGYNDDEMSATTILKSLTANINRKTLNKLLQKLFVIFEKDRGALEYIIKGMFHFGIYGGNIRGAPAERKSEKEQDGKCFPYIPYDSIGFINAITKIAYRFDRQKKDFIDVGSGIADKVYLAHLLGFKTATGVEINEHTSHLAKHFLHELSEKEVFLINQDAFDLDFSEYNFIYMYRPISDEKLLEKLHKKVLDEMPVGGEFIDVGCDMKDVLERYSGESINTKKDLSHSTLYITKNKNDEKPHLNSYRGC